MNKQDENDPQDFWPSVTIIVLNWNGRALLEQCLPALLQQNYPNFNVLLVDNASEDDSVGYVKSQFPQIQVIQNEANLGFAKGNNLGIQNTESDIVVLLNTDVTVQSNWLSDLIGPMVSDETIGVAGCKLLFPEGNIIQHAGGYLTFPLAYSQHYHYRERDEGQVSGVKDVPYVTAAVFAIRRETLINVGLLDGGFSPFYYEEVDYCYRVKEAGWRVVLVGNAAATHWESTSMKKVPDLQKRAFHKNRLRFILKHYTKEQFLHDFIPAEAARLGEPATPQDYHLMGQLYLETAVNAPDILEDRWPKEAVSAGQTALMQLREIALAQEPVVYQLDAESWPQRPLLQKQRLEAYQFSSDTAVIGPLIASFRSHWNNVAARWSVGHVIQQQNSFNRLLTQVLDELDSRSQTNAVDIGLLLAELLKLQQSQTQLMQETQKELTQLRQQLHLIEQALSK